MCKGVSDFPGRAHVAISQPRAFKLPQPQNADTKLSATSSPQMPFKDPVNNTRRSTSMRPISTHVEQAPDSSRPHAHKRRRRRHFTIEHLKESHERPDAKSHCTALAHMALRFGQILKP